MALKCLVSLSSNLRLVYPRLEILAARQQHGKVKCLVYALKSFCRILFKKFITNIFEIIHLLLKNENTYFDGI